MHKYNILAATVFWHQPVQSGDKVECGPGAEFLKYYLRAPRFSLSENILIFFQRNDDIYMLVSHSNTYPPCPNNLFLLDMDKFEYCPWQEMG